MYLRRDLLGFLIRDEQPYSSDKPSDANRKADREGLSITRGGIQQRAYSREEGYSAYNYENAAIPSGLSLFRCFRLLLLLSSFSQFGHLLASWRLRVLA